MMKYKYEVSYVNDLGIKVKSYLSAYDETDALSRLYGAISIDYVKLAELRPSEKIYQKIIETTMDIENLQNSIYFGDYEENSKAVVFLISYLKKLETDFVLAVKGNN